MGWGGGGGGLVGTTDKESHHRESVVLLKWHSDCARDDAKPRLCVYIIV